MKLLFILLACYAVISLLDNVSAKDLTSKTDWYTVTPYDRCMMNLSNYEQCKYLEIN